MTTFINNTSYPIEIEFWIKEIIYPKTKSSGKLKYKVIEPNNKCTIASINNEYYIFNINNEKLCTIENNKITILKSIINCTFNNNEYILEENSVKDNILEDNSKKENSVKDNILEDNSIKR
jgi:hypothetical protein